MISIPGNPAVVVDLLWPVEGIDELRIEQVTKRAKQLLAQRGQPDAEVKITLEYIPEKQAILCLGTGGTLGETPSPH